MGEFVQINRAHLIRLRSVGLINQADAATIAASIDGLCLERLAASEHTGEYEDLFFTVESQRLALSGDVVGNPHVARSRNDIGMCPTRPTDLRHGPPALPDSVTAPSPAGAPPVQSTAPTQQET